MMTATPIDPRNCWGFIGCKDVQAQYLAGGPQWLAGLTRSLVAATGCRGVVHHLPMLWQGVSVGGVPQFGFAMVAWLRAKGPDHARIANTYAHWMDPLVRDGIRILPYLGSLRLSPELDRLDLKHLNDRMRMLGENIKPVCEAGIKEVVIDGSVSYWQYGEPGATVELFESCNLTVWRESNPSEEEVRELEHIFVENDTYLNRLSMPQYASVKLTGPVMRLVKAPNGEGLSWEQWGEKWAATAAPQIRAVLSDNHIPVVEALDKAMRYSRDSFAGGLYEST